MESDMKKGELEYKQNMMNLMYPAEYKERDGIIYMNSKNG